MGEMKIQISNRCICHDAPTDLVRELRKRLSFQNPAWIENKRMGRWNGGTPEMVECFHDLGGNSLSLPRGYMRQLLGLCKKHGVVFEIIDNRRALPQVDFEFSANLRPFQSQAVADVLSEDFGTLSSPTGSGKTVVALHVIAERKQPALIIVHTKELLNQWRDRIETFLETPKTEIGIIGAGKRTVGDRITVALVQSLYKCADEVATHVGQLIVDECHRAPSRTFTEAVSAFDSKYMLGLSATPWRRDGLSKLIFWHVGDVVHTVDPKTLQDAGDILRAEVVWRNTEFHTDLDPSGEYSKVLSELTRDYDRNKLICMDVAGQAGNGGGICLVLTDRKAHCMDLGQTLEEDFNVPVSILTGEVPDKKRKEIVADLNQGKGRVVIATSQLIGEGFDLPAINTIFLSTPIRFDGRLIQCMGRALRPAPGKSIARVYDYIDVRVPVLKASAKARGRVYDKG